MPDTDIEPGLGLSDATGGIEAFSRGAAFFLSATGKTQGKIQGNSTTKGEEGTIEALGFQVRINSPRDVFSGEPVGRRLHFPVHVAFKLDKSAPKWYNAIAHNETMTKVVIDCWGGISKASGIGKGTGYKKIYSLELKDANIERFKQFTAVTGELCLTIGFTFNSITYTWVDGGIQAIDNWLSDAA
jgi:type VI secretion system Hcp family effector